MANINSNKIEEINRWFSERKQNENPTNYEYYMETLKDLKNLNISDKYSFNKVVRSQWFLYYFRNYGWTRNNKRKVWEW